MKNMLIIFSAIFFIACHQADKEETGRNLIMPKADTVLTMLQTAVHDSLVHIITRETQLSGYTVKTVQVSGMEIIKISKKEYYSQEMKSQETDFNRYVELMAKYAKTNSPGYNPQQLEQNKVKHNAVMAYLKKTINSSSSLPELYQAEYYVQVDAGLLKYQRQQTTFLDKDLKKITADYGFLKIKL